MPSDFGVIQDFPREVTFGEVCRIRKGLVNSVEGMWLGVCVGL